MNLYLDVDGVILTSSKSDGRKTLASGVEPFIDYILEHYRCYWLTTHCHGDVQNVLSYLQPFCSSSLMSKLEKLRPTSFQTFKTEAIDFSQPFLWFDDYAFSHEIEVLKKNGCLSSWYKVNTDQDEDALVKFLDQIRV